MANITSFRKLKGDQKTHPLSNPSRGYGENVIDLAIWKSREAIKKAIKNINDMVVIPAAVLAVMAR